MLEMPASRVLIVPLLAFAGCSGTTATQVYDALGQPALMIECGIDMPACLQRADEECPQGYDLLDPHDLLKAQEGQANRRHLWTVTQIEVRCRAEGAGP